jgi:hypothetical protein
MSTAIRSSSFYFDTNLYDHLHKRIGVTDTEVDYLVSAVKKGEISVLPSVRNIEEVLSCREADLPTAAAELQLIFDLTGGARRLIRPQNELLVNDIDCFIRGTESLNHLTEVDLRSLTGPEDWHS